MPVCRAGSMRSMSKKIRKMRRLLAAMEHRGALSLLQTERSIRSRAHRRMRRSSNSSSLPCRRNKYDRAGAPHRVPETRIHSGRGSRCSYHVRDGGLDAESRSCCASHCRSKCNLCPKNLAAYCTPLINQHQLQRALGALYNSHTDPFRREWGDDDLLPETQDRSGKGQHDDRGIRRNGKRRPRCRVRRVRIAPSYEHSFQFRSGGRDLPSSAPGRGIRNIRSSPAWSLHLSRGKTNPKYCPLFILSKSKGKI